VEKEDKIYVAGHRGMVGSAIVRLLESRGFGNLLLACRDDLDLRDSLAVAEFFKNQKPDIVILAAARVGGIQANLDFPAEFLYENLAIQNNVIHQSYLHEVKKFCFLGSSCIYPRLCPQPMKEEYLLSGPLEPTNEGYALAKIAGLKMVEFYRRQYGFDGVSIMPCNLYGTGDNFDPDHSHVLSALVKKFVDAVDSQAESVTVWGSGKARREFMHVADAAEAILFVMDHSELTDLINIGAGSDVAIKELALLVAEKAGYKGRIDWDTSRPDGMPRKCMDVSQISKLGFAPKISLEQGVQKTIDEYRKLKSAVL
jgi:GDP-L-fucose synthase